MIEETKPCEADKDVVPCPKKAQAAFFTSWGPWGPCQAECGEKGVMKRARQCVGKGDCDGKGHDEETCDSVCPESKFN